MAKNPCNLSAYKISKTFSISYNIYIVFRNQEKIIFYINKFIK